MAAGPTKLVVRYGFDVQFERTLAVALCYLPQLFGVIGRELQPEKLLDPTAALLVRAVQAVAKDVGHGPHDAVVVIQRLRRWQDEGKLTAEEIDEAFDVVLATTEGVSLESVGDEILSEVVPVVQHHMRGDAVRTALDDYGKRGDFSAVTDIVLRASALGTVDRSTGSKLNLSALAGFARLRNAHRLSTGVVDLDMGLNGGVMRGTASLIIGAAKAGKSMCLINLCVCSMKQGLFVALVTLELSEEDQQARLLANITGIPIDSILDGTADAAVIEVMTKLMPSLGAFRVKFFAAKATKMTDVASWVAEIEAEEGRKVDVLVIDYIDKMGSGNPKHQSEYDVQGAAAESWRLYCHNRNIWGWSASQPKRRDKKDRQKRIELDDVADSMGKIRVVDLIITVHSPADGEIEFFVAGNRHGKSQFSVGPYAHDFASARIGPE